MTAEPKDPVQAGLLDVGGTFAAVLTTQVAAHPDGVFLSFPDSELSYEQLHRRAIALARGLVAVGLRPGGHVAILMTNSLTYVELMFATYLAGGVVVPINARFKRRELRFVLAHCDAEILITTDMADDHTDFTELISQALPDLQRSVEADRSVDSVHAPRLRQIFLSGTKTVPFAAPLSDLIKAGRRVDESAVIAASAARGPGDMALLLYTSGTTADPKGCELTHEALLRSWSAYADVVGLRAGQSMWAPIPFFHVGGIGVMTAALLRGATMMTMAHFDPAVALEHLARRKAEHLFPAFPPLTLGLLRAPGYDRTRFDFIRTVLNVAPLETQQMIEGMVPSGAVLLTDFGMTEGAGMITVTPLDALEADRLGRNGSPLPGIEVRVMPESGVGGPLPSDVPGEIQFRGINAFRAYYKDPAATAAAILPGGWVRTGDRGSLNNSGSLLFLGRIKDILKVGGESMSPIEVESHLSTHPAVGMAQVVGRPSEKYGEEPVAFVELKADMSCTAEELIAYCVGHLASYKLPREVRFVTSWPMSATKVQKFRLREML